jgi:predicted ATPase
MSDATHPSGGAHDGGSLISFPGGHTTSATPEINLPLQLTSFVGRERELSEARGLMANSRLLTLTGPGGAGKTRLASAVAFEVAAGFEDGVWWVELAPVSDPDLMPQAVATVLRIDEIPGRSLTDVIADDLKGLDLLLVLDNCEHLIGSCAELANTLLRACPGLKILATSREALYVAGERIWPLPPLSYPDPHSLPPIEELENIESVRLFVERASYRLPGFALDSINAPAVAEVCARLEGMPLAIELTAARVGTVPLSEIPKRLDRSLGLLSSRDRTAPERLRTLMGALDWSYELLDEEEREVFRGLSVFAGGFTLDAAESVCDGGSIESREVLDLLTRLIDKSLLLVTERGEEVRYRLLETIRQYALEKLQESGEEDVVRERHAKYYLALAEKAGSKLKGPDQGAWLERLETEHDNLRAALTSALEGGNAELGLRLGGALGEFWHLRG